MMERPVSEVSIDVSWFTVNTVVKRSVRLFRDHDIEELMIAIFQFHFKCNGRMDVAKIM